MLFCAGIGSDILYWVLLSGHFIIKYLLTVQNQCPDQALQYATQYGMFHWGPIAWAIYATSIANRLFSFR